MYTLLLNSTNELITTVKERIMQRSKLVDDLHILVEPTYKGIDMSDWTVCLEYVLPISKEYHTEFLVKSDELYKGSHLEYKLPFDTRLTAEPGDVKLQLTFIKVDINESGQSIQRVRKTSETSITIVPISAWSDLIADNSLNALDQRIIQIDAAISALDELSQTLYDNQVDNISYDKSNNIIQLVAKGQPIGDAIKLNGCSSDIVSIKVDDNGNLIVIHKDGSEENLGNLSSGECAGIYVPSLEGDQMIFTLKDKATEPVISIDIDKTNEWNEIEEPEQSSNYVWEEL